MNEEAKAAKPFCIDLRELEDVRDGKGMLIPMPRLTAADSPYKVGDEVVVRIWEENEDYARAMGKIVRILEGLELEYVVESYNKMTGTRVASIRDVWRVGI